MARDGGGVAAGTGAEANHFIKRNRETETRGFCSKHLSLDTEVLHVGRLKVDHLFYGLLCQRFPGRR